MHVPVLKSSLVSILLLTVSLSGCIGDSSDQEKMQVEQLQVIDITQGENSSSPGGFCFNSEYCTSFSYYEHGNNVYFSTSDQVNVYSMETHTAFSADEMVPATACGWCTPNEKPMRPIYFEDRAYSIENNGLWVHNFSTFESVLVYDLAVLGDGYRPLSGNSKNPGKYMSLVLDEMWFFSSDSADFGLELWSMNLVNHEVSLVIDTATGKFVHGQDQQEYPRDGDPGKHLSMVLGNKLLFSAFNGTGHTLWIHDNSNSSTWEIPDIDWASRGFSPGSQFVQAPLFVDDLVYFSDMNHILAYNTTNHDLSVVVDDLENLGLTFFEYHDGVLYFDARPEFTLDGKKLWAHNLSNSTSWLINEHGSFQDSTSAGWYDNTTYFSAHTAELGSELWGYNSVNLTSWLIDDINNGEDSSSPQYLGIGKDGVFYFSADDGIHGRELWAYNTQTSTSWLFSDINPGSNGSNPGGFNSASSSFETKEILFFAADNDEFGLELWRLIH